MCFILCSKVQDRVVRWDTLHARTYVILLKNEEVIFKIQPYQTNENILSNIKTLFLQN